MKETSKTKKELIEEIKTLRAELSGLKNLKDNNLTGNKAAEVIKMSQHRYKGLFENMLDGAAYHEIVLDKNNNPIDYIFLEVNSAFETHTGLKRKDVLGKRVTEIIPGIDKADPDLISIYGKVAVSGKGTTFDLFFEPLDRWYCISAYSPEKGFFVSIFEDITARKQMEKTLIKDKKMLEEKVRERTAELARANENLLAENIERRHKEETLIVAQEFGMMGNWVHNLQTGELTWSEQIFRLFGLEPGEIKPTYKTYLGFIHPDDKELVSSSGEMSFREHKPYNIEFRVIRKDGEERVFHSKAKIIKDKSGKPLMRIGVNQDITQSKRAREALEESEKFLSVAQEIAHLGHWKLDPETNEVTGSDELYRIFGLKRESSAFDSFLDIVHPDDRDFDLSTIKRGIEEGTDWNIEHRLILKDGTEKTVQAIGNVIKDKTGKTTQLIGTIQDITVRKKDEKTLKEAKETYEGMFLNSMVGMSRTRLSDGKFMEINDRLVEMFGYDDREDFIKKYSAVKCYAIEGERDRALGLMKEFGEIKNFETLAIRKDGSTFWIQYSGRIDKDGGYLDAVSLDIDEQKHAQDELKISKQFLQNIIDNTTAIIYVKDLDGNYLHSNSMHKKLFQKEHNDIIGINDYDIFPKEMADIFRSNDQKVLKANAPVEFEEIAPHDDGPHTYLSIKFPINDTEGNPYAVCGISTDITERKRTSERIEAMNRCFLGFGTDSAQNILSLTHLLGSLMQGTCALYNRIDQEMLCTVSEWNTPADYNPVDKPDGRICHDVIKNENDDIFYIGDLTQTKYAETDINVVKYNLKSYIGKAVTCNGKHVGSLCVVFTDQFTPSEEDKKYLEIIAVAIGIEEERKLAGEKLSRSRENLRNLSMHLQNMQEQERGRIARDIHDDLGQLLTALDFDLAFVSKRLRDDQEELREKADKMSELIRVSTETVQRIASELRPALLDNLGLMAAMEWQADEFSAHTGIDCKVKFESSLIIENKDLSIALFRAFQEALTNAARHASASKISVNVKENSGRLTLKIADDGKGISEEEITNKNSFGISGIMERFYPFGGIVKIKGIKDKGTTVSIEVPYWRKK